MRGGITVAIVGQGHTGSYAADLVARMERITRVKLIDPGTYEEANLFAQAIRVSDVGRPKVEAAAERMRAANRTLEIEPYGMAVEEIPAGALHDADAVLGNVDNDETRLYLSETTYHLGLPYIDCGVRAGAGGLYARVSIYVPGPDSACMECAWDHERYLGLQVRYPCEGGMKAAPPTNSPAALGNLTASMQILEFQRLLDGGVEPAGPGREIILEATSHRSYVTELPRRETCRFGHTRWDVQLLDRGPERVTLGDALALGEWFGPVGHIRLVTRLTCPECGSGMYTMMLSSRLQSRERKCTACGGGMVAAGYDMCEAVNAELAGDCLGLTLGEIGFRAGDIFAVTAAGEERHYELANGRRRP